jgi:hypothetical protein
MRTEKIPRLLYIRSLLPPVAFYLGFAALLLTYFALAHGNLQPGPTGRMAWQANEAIQLYAPKQENAAASGSAGDAASPDELMGESIDGALPLDSWNPLLPHRTGRESAWRASHRVSGHIADLCLPNRDCPPLAVTAIAGKWLSAGSCASRAGGRCTPGWRPQRLTWPNARYCS